MQLHSKAISIKVIHSEGCCVSFDFFYAENDFKFKEVALN